MQVLPNDPVRTGLARDPRMGELAPRIGAVPGLYRGLRPEALAMALYIGAQTREYAGGEGPLMVTSTVRDEEYQRRLVRGNGEATRNYSLHTTGWAFDIARVYRSKRQALAFQFVLDRLQVLNVIAWVREPERDPRHGGRRRRGAAAAARAARGRMSRLRGRLVALRRRLGDHDLRGRRARRRARLVGGAGAAIGVQQRAVELQRAADGLARAPRHEVEERPGRPDRLRHEDVEARRT